jgi:hypothetical protein
MFALNEEILKLHLGETTTNMCMLPPPPPSINKLPDFN